MSQGFLTSLIGSMPRNQAILVANRDLKKGRITQEFYDQLIEESIKEVIYLQEKYDIDFITSGELARDNYVSFIADSLSGVEMMSMSEMIEYIEDKKAYEGMLEVLDVPSSTIKNAICTDKIRRIHPLVKKELEILHKYTSRKKKITLPGPYLMTRSMWLKGVSDKFYASKEALAEDVISCLAEEVRELQEIGVDIIQFDEPVLTEVVFSPENTRTFMCASLSEKKDPTQELEFATSLIKGLFEKIDRKKSQVALHVCRGNWSKEESILLTGPYTPLLKLFSSVKADQYILEFSTDRAGSVDSLFKDTNIFEKAVLGLGVMNPRLDDTESIELMTKKVHQVLKYLPAEKIYLNPDCGFATFAQKPVNIMENIEKKIEILNRLKEEMRHEQG